MLRASQFVESLPVGIQLGESWSVERQPIEPVIESQPVERQQLKASLWRDSSRKPACEQPTLQRALRGSSWKTQPEKNTACAEPVCGVQFYLGTYKVHVKTGAILPWSS